MLRAPEQPLEPARTPRGTTRVHLHPHRSTLPRARRLLLAAAWLALVPLPLQAQDTRPARAAAPVRVPGVGALRPDSVLTPPGGPKLIRLTAPGSGLTTLRLSVRVDETPAEAGAAQILVNVGLERARAAGAPMGAEVEGTRTPWGITYTV